MRGMNMLQMVGGVAVAGAVAAGTTAFTAAGFTRASGITSATVVGGKLSQTIIGATLNGVSFTYDATNPDRVKGLTVTLAGDGGTLPVGSLVTIASTGTKTTGTEFFCLPTTTVPTTTNQAAACVFGSDANTQAGYVTALSALDITVNGPSV